MGFLIDECLSIDLILVAGCAGYEAGHVAHIGKAGWKDWNVLDHAIASDFVLVTNNGGDFRKLYRTQPLHAGLVIIVPSVDRDMQRLLFRAAIGALAQRGEPVNRVLEVDLADEDVTFNFYELP